MIGLAASPGIAPLGSALRRRKGDYNSGTMRKRLLGRTGLEVSEIGVGAWQLGGPLVLNGKADGHPDLGREAVVGLIRRCG